MNIRQLLPFALVLASGALNGGESGAYFPGKNWRTSTPEAQGLDSTVLARMVGDISEKKLNVHSITVIRHGYVVMDAYFYPFRPDTLHDSASMAKSVTATLIGIAADKGLLKTDEKLLPLFPKDAPKDPEPSKQQITVDDLLTMRTGMDCGVKPGEQELDAMRRSDNFVEYALSIPMLTAPGTKFSYCSPGFHLLSAVLTKAVHTPEESFATANLFGPIGITHSMWSADAQGNNHGWGDLKLYPTDYARIGYLYLHDGNWNGRQVVSADWVKQATSAHENTGRPGVDYGYGWWLYPNRNPPEFSADGRGGQKIAVWPDKDMVVVVTGGGYPASAVAPIAAAIKSDSALPENAEADRALREKIAEVERQPMAEPVEAAPEIAKHVSGVFYNLPRNPSRLDGIGLTFNGKDAQLKVRYLGQDFSMPIGLDGVYRLGPYGPLKMLAGARGHWTSDSDFLLDLNFISNINHYTLAMHFAGDSVDITANESSGLARNVHVTGAKQ